MKIRNGFVSNSSSSSFVVRRCKDFMYTISNLSEDQLQKMDKYGFKYIQSVDEYVYDVACNEDSVIDFLIENKIPFEAKTHYGHYTQIYNPDTNTLVKGVNFGEMYATYKSMEYVEKQKPITVYVADKWTKGELIETELTNED